MKITTSVQLALAAAGAAFVVLFGSILFANAAMNYSNEQRQELYSVVLGTAELQIRTDEYLKNFSTRPLRQWNSRNKAIIAALNNIKPSAKATRQEIASLMTRHIEIAELFYKLQKLGLPGEDRSRRMQQQLLIDHLFIKYEEQLGEAAHVRQNTLQADRKNLQRAVTFSAVTLALLTVIFLAAMYVVRRNLSAPIQKLVEATEAIGSGELGHRIGESPNNEIGGLSQALNTMAARLQNVTAELNNTHEKLRQAQKMEAIGQLTGGIAHDFNNFLAGMKGNLEIMRLRLTQNRAQDIGGHITSALSLTDRAAALTHRLLAFSRQQALDPKVTDINVLTASMLPLIEQTIGPHIKLTFNQENDLWQTLSDTNQLENALLNLVINSRDAMPDGGDLTIETANMDLDEDAGEHLEDMKPGQYVCLGVIDTGSGMSPKVVERVFDPFFTTKPIGQGTGLGLSMIYGFIRQSEGHVRIISSPNGGTKVELLLPRFIPDPSIESKVSVPHETTFESVESAGSKEVTVLVVDDESVVRSVVVEILIEMGYRVLEAEDGNSALKILQSNETFKLLVTDIGLPNGMNGTQLADAAREQRPELKVLFITGYALNALPNHNMLAKGTEIMTKPFSMSSFAAKVRSMFEDDTIFDAQQNTDSANSSPAKQLTILVIDDNKDAATTLGILLEAKGHKVHVAHDGQSGVEAAKTFIPDVVLLDIGMPIMNGYEAARAIRKAPALEHTTLIALTGRDAKDDRAKAKEAGFNYHLTKPANLSVIDKLLAQLDDHS